MFVQGEDNHSISRHICYETGIGSDEVLQLPWSLASQVTLIFLMGSWSFCSTLLTEQVAGQPQTLGPA